MFACAAINDCSTTNPHRLLKFTARWRTFFSFFWCRDRIAGDSTIGEWRFNIKHDIRRARNVPECRNAEPSNAPSLTRYLTNSTIISVFESEVNLHDRTRLYILTCVYMCCVARVCSINMHQREVDSVCRGRLLWKRERNSWRSKGAKELVTNKKIFCHGCSWTCTPTRAYYYTVEKLDK